MLGVGGFEPPRRPEDIAEVIFFLCAGGAMITGQTIIVDGGLTL